MIILIIEFFIFNFEGTFGVSKILFINCFLNKNLNHNNEKLKYV